MNIPGKLKLENDILVSNRVYDATISDRFEIKNATKTFFNIETANDKMTLDAKDLVLKTEGFNFNETSEKAKLLLDDINSIVTIGGSELDNTYIRGSNIEIGRGGSKIVLYGDVQSYST